MLELECGSSLIEDDECQVVIVLADIAIALLSAGLVVDVLRDLL